jgi:hypothetical protein
VGCVCVVRLEETKNSCIILQGNVLENVTRNGAGEVGLKYRDSVYCVYVVRLEETKNSCIILQGIILKNITGNTEELVGYY